MISFAYESLFADSSINKQYHINVYDGSTLEAVITNVNLYSEEIEFSNPLCTEKMLRYGACESSYVKFKVRSDVGTLKNKKIEIILSFDDFITQSKQLKIGEYYVDSDQLSDDRKSREIIAYDKIFTIINTDIAQWYSELTFPISMKDFRDEFFDFFGIEQVEKTLCNDIMPITQTTLPDTLSGLDVLQSICGGNGALGVINNEGKFKYIILSEAVSKAYETHYKQGSLVYEDYTVKPCTGLKFLSVFNNKEIEVKVGTDDNMYIMEDNFLFYDKNEDDVLPFVENIFNVIKDTPAYRPLRADTYGDFCVEPGDIVSFRNVEGNVLSTIVLNKVTKGLQSLTDSFDVEGTEYFEYDLTDNNSQIRRLWNNTLALLDGAKTYVYAHRNTEDIHIVHTIERTIITIPVATVDDTIPVFLATIPLTMDRDGEITFRYFLDGVEINTKDTDTIYLTKGEQFVTLSTFFVMNANQNKRFTVTARTGYRQSVEREQTAKIISLKDWIDNQSITVDTQAGTASFDYDYVEYPIDTTPPGAIIYDGEIRAMIFASGLASEEPWDGTIISKDYVNDFDIADISVYDNVSDTVSVATQTPIGPNAITQNVSSFNLIDIAFDGNVNDSTFVVVHTDSFPMITESNEDAIMLEDGVYRLYTEGD